VAVVVGRKNVSAQNIPKTLSKLPLRRLRKTKKLYMWLEEAKPEGDEGVSCRIADKRKSGVN